MKSIKSKTCLFDHSSPNTSADLPKHVQIIGQTSVSRLRIRYTRLGFAKKEWKRIIK